MAKYRFQCEKCLTVFERYTSVKTEVLSCKECDDVAKRLFPNIGSQKVTEVVDPFLNIRHEEDQKKKIEDRRSAHFWANEVPRFVESGIYSIETMLAEGWVIYNERGELVVGKRPKNK